MCSRRLSILALSCLFALAGTETAAAQQQPIKKPVIILTKLAAPADDPVAERLASTLTGSVDLIMRLTGSLEVKRADFLVPGASLERAIEYYKQADADGAVFGSISPGSNGSYNVDLEVWSAGKPNSKPESFHRHITDLLSSFALSDQLSLQVASAVAGRDLKEGTIFVKNTANLTSYSVYADGHLLGRNRETFPILTGHHEIVVAKPGLVGDEPVQVFHVTITKDHTTTLDVSPPKTPEPAKQETPTLSAKPVPPTPKVAAAPPKPTEGSVVFHVTTKAAAANGTINVSGPSGTKSIGFSTYTVNPKPVTLLPGTYTVTASMGEDPGFGYTGTIRILAGETITEKIEVSYSTGYQISLLQLQRTNTVNNLAVTTQKRHKDGVGGAVLVSASLATGALAVLSYFAGSTAYKSYQSATTVSDLTTYRSQASLYGSLTVAGAITGAVAAIWGISVLRSRPSAQSIQNLQSSIDDLDKQLKILAETETKGK
jgi:hypothetical protein